MRPIVNYMVALLVLVCLKTEAASAPLLYSPIFPSSNSGKGNIHVFTPSAPTSYKKVGFLRKLQYKLALKSITRLSKGLDEGTQPKKNRLSTISLVLGIIGAVALFIPGIAGIALIAGPAALITGIIALGKRYNNSKASRTKAIIGVVLGGILVALGIAAVIILAAFASWQ